jgi:hypothetical protein
VRGRLYRRIFFFLLLFIAVALALSAIASHLLLSEVVRTHVGGALTAHALALAGRLPEAGRPDAEQQAALESLAKSRGLHAALWGPDGRRLAFTDIDIPTPRPGTSGDEWLPSPSGPALAAAWWCSRIVSPGPAGSCWRCWRWRHCSPSQATRPLAS